MKNSIKIIAKSSGNYFIGSERNDSQSTVDVFNNPTQAVKFFSNNFSKVIKATYSQSQIYYQHSVLTSKSFWKLQFENKLKANYENAILNLAKKVRAKASLKAAELKESEIMAEVNLITIDSQYTKEVEEAKKINGIDKNNAYSSALKGLLSRNGIEKLKYFYQVMGRI